MLDYLGGAADNPTADAPQFLTNPIFLGIWWGVFDDNNPGGSVLGSDLEVYLD